MVTGTSAAATGNTKFGQNLSHFSWLAPSDSDSSALSLCLSLSFLSSCHSAETVCQLAKYPFKQNIHSNLYFYGQSNIRSKHVNVSVLANHSDSMMLLDLIFNKENLIFLRQFSYIKLNSAHVSPLVHPRVKLRKLSENVLSANFLSRTQKNKKESTKERDLNVLFL